MLGKNGFLKTEMEINSVVDRLYSYKYKDKSLLEALSVFKGLGEAKGLLYTPQICCFVKITPNGKAFDDKGELSNNFLNSVFEARIFNKDVEMRWLHQQNLLGRLVLISEKLIDSEKDNLLDPPIELAGEILQNYLLWGKVKETKNGWTYLVTSRIGKIAVPSPKTLKQEKRLILKAKEYLQEKDYGNVVVIEERLIDLEAIND